MDYKDINILFVLVLYKCKLEDSDTYITLSNSAKQNKYKFSLVVYNNSPEIVDNYAEIPYISITYINNKENEGVSKAYNSAARLATQMGKKWLILLDQDTSFPVNSITEYLNAIERYPTDKIFAPVMVANDKSIISPGISKYGRNFSGKESKPGVYNFKNKSLINCGLCIEINSFWEVNGFNENIQLDFSDHDFIKRFKKKTAQRFILINLVVKHQLSVSQKNSLESDKIRFNYYLQGINYMSANAFEKSVYTMHGFLRACKLSAQHYNPIFVVQIIKSVFLKKY